MRAVARLLILPLALAAVAAPALADAPRIENFAYRLYISGLKVGKADLTARISEDSYVVTAHAKTIGVVSWFERVDADARVEGRFSAEGFVTPELFEMKSVTNDSERMTLRMPFSGDGPSGVEAEPPLREVHYAIDPKDQSGALDPLSALAAALLPSEAGAPCDRTISIFDGRRRFDIAIGAPSKSYKKRGVGHVRCDARFIRRGGYKEKHMTRPDMKFTVDFALTKNGVAKPTRLSSDTDFGPAVAVLQKY